MADCKRLDGHGANLPSLPLAQQVKLLGRNWLEALTRYRKIPVPPYQPVFQGRKQPEAWEVMLVWGLGMC